MHLSLKNKYFASLVVTLACASFSYVSAEPKKTWTKDANGRVLIYRAEPSKLALVGWSACSALGSFMLYISLNESEEFFRNKDGGRLGGGLCGLFCTGLGIYGLQKWYHNYDSLFKPLIIIDKTGITYEGKDKIPWKKVCGYQHVKRTIYINGARDHDEDYIEISTDTNKLEIFEYDIAITWHMLYKLIDEAYSAYQELEKERAAA